MAIVTEMPPSEAEESAPDTPVAEQKAPPNTPRKAGRPKKGSVRTPDAKQPPFFHRVASVPKEDWGERAFMYVYADEPVCTKKTFGETRYILKSSRPILDLEGLKQDYGSFKGWMTLNLRKTGKDVTDEIDRLHFEIYDPKFPPKIPRSAWANDDRNKRWADLLPPEPKPVADGAASIIEGARFYKEIRDEVKGEMPEEPAANTTRETLETMKLAKELFAPIANGTGTPSQESPLKIAVDLATTMMQMKADNPVIDMYRDELKAMREELKEAHAEMRKSQSAPSKGFVDQILEVVAAADKLEPVKKFFSGIFGGNNVTGEGIVQTSRRTTGMDILRDFVQSPAAAKIGDGLGTLLTTIATPPTIIPTNAVPNTNGAMRPQVAGQETDQQRIVRIAQTITGPMLDEYFDEEESGDTFAANMFNFWPADLKFMQGLGAQRILELYRGFPPAWGRIGPKETQFAQFLKELCEWKPDTEDQAESDGIVDLEERSEAASA